MKELVRSRFPRLFGLARDVKDQLRIEVQVARQIGLAPLAGRFRRRSRSWRQALPLQRPRRVSIPEIDFRTQVDLVRWLERQDLPFSQGGHTVYLPPETVRGSAFSLVGDDYPPETGLKIAKNPGSIDESVYFHLPEYSSLHMAVTHSHRHLSLVANLLFLEGIGPRLYDLLELEIGAQLWTAYAIEHCDGREATMAECEAGIARLRELERSRVLKVTAPGGYRHNDFVCPQCNGNCLVDRFTGEFRYFDFQNFLLTGYGELVEGLVRDAARDTHFGDRSLLRGGSYVYQSVPGMGRPAKRDVDARAALLDEMMRSAGVSVSDRLVLDIGCNLGMMSGQYLKLGARWCHGWDKESIIPHAKRVLLALGCTRFSLTGCTIAADRDFTGDVPPFLWRELDGGVISYLAVRGHIGWVAALGRLPWAFMLYEGHEGESLDDFADHVRQLRELTPVDVPAVRVCTDGDSRARPVAVIVREGSASREP